MTPAEAIRVLEGWLAGLSDEYEYDQNFRLETLENPGWMLHAEDLHEDLYGVSAPRQLVDRSDTDWISWHLDDGRLLAACGPANLGEMLVIVARLIVEGRRALP